MKRCSKCREIKSDDQFYRRKVGYYAGSFIPACISCQSVIAKEFKERKRLGLALKTKPSRIISEDEVRCSKCKQVKNKSEFYICKTGLAKGKPAPMCKPCNSDSSKLWMKGLDPAARWAYSRTYTLKKFGLTWHDFEALVEKQRGKCLICGEVPKGILRVDHNHKTGEVRGLLCNACNLGLGRVEKFWRQSEKYLIETKTLPKESRITFDVSSEDMIDWDHEYYGVND